MKKIITSFWLLVVLLNCNSTTASFKENIKGKWINESIHLDINDERFILSKMIVNQRIEIINRKYKIKERQGKYYIHLLTETNSELI